MNRFRFAPSPTGHLHIGGARTALYNYLMAKKIGGTFILRVEDTDVERSTQDYIDSILEGMKWLGLSWDEGPYFQMERSELHRQHLQKLLQEGKAYRCFCSSEEIEAKRKQAMIEGRKPKYEGTCRSLDPQKAAQDSRPHCIRFLSEDAGTTVVDDLIKGRVEFDNAELDDLVIARTDGTPTYNFVVVVDDVTMQITHVIRGDDHLNNTPRQIQLYRAFDYPTPIFAHVPMILGSDKTRLSKRHGATSVLAYRDQGFLPEALLNYLVRLGWSHGDEEIFSMQQMIEHFDIADVGKSAAIFNPEKLLWLNGHWIRQSKPAYLLQQSLALFKQENIPVEVDDYAEKAIATCQEKVKTLVELVEMSAFYFRDEIKISDADQAKINDEATRALLQKLAGELQTCEDYSTEALHEVLQKFCESQGVKLGKIAQPLRLILTGSSISPGIYDLMAVLGKSAVLLRLKNWLSA